MELKDKDKLQKAAGMDVKHEKTELEHEKDEDNAFKQIHKHVKHALAMGDMESATESLEAIDKLIKGLLPSQKKVEKADEKKVEKKEEKKPEEKKEPEKKEEEKK